MDHCLRFKTPLTLGIFSALLAVSLFQGGRALASSFYDVPASDLLFSPYIEKLYSAHLITGDTQNGIPTHAFRPRDTLTRAEFTKVAVGVKLAEKFGTVENWSEKSEYEMTETVLKDKLLYFHKCDNSDVPNCSSTQGADITGVCNVCQLTNEKPFTDVKEKERNCEELGICSPWYSEYIYYALRKGMLQGYHDGPSSWSFHPNEPILRIHALKLIMADSGALDPEADERYRRLSQTAKSRGAYYPKCLSGAEPYILTQNGGPENSDAQKLLKYALLADQLDFFGNQCQVFKSYNANSPEARATFLHSYLTRQEVARYFVLSASYPPLQIPPADDSSVDEIVSYVSDPTQIKPIADSPALPPGTPPSTDPTLKVYADNIAIQTSPFPSTYNRTACIKSLSTPRLCHSASLSNCFTVPSGTRLTTTSDEYYGKTPPGYYTQLWHGVIYQGATYYTPTDDLDFLCKKPTPTVIASLPTNSVKMASATVTETTSKKGKVITYHSPDCGVIMSCEPIVTYETVYETKVVPGICGVNMSCESQVQAIAPNNSSVCNPEIMSCAVLKSDSGKVNSKELGFFAKGFDGLNSKLDSIKGLLPTAIESVKEVITLPNELREFGFFVRNRTEALEIGIVAHGGKGHSSVASRFARHAFSDNSGKGSKRNAYRHALWMLIIASEYSESLARQVGNAHEDNPYVIEGVDLDNGQSFTSEDEADGIVDLLNNEIGRSIADENSMLNSNKQRAERMLNVFLENGLYIFEADSDEFVVKKYKLTDKEYNAAKRELDLIVDDQHGFTQFDLDILNNEQ